MRRSPVIATLAAVVVMSTTLVGGAFISPSPAAAAPRPVLYLTFDDGPGPYTTQFLDLLGRYGIRSTFFVTGQATAANAGLARRIAAEGHAIGNHSYRHPRLTSLSNSAILSELTATNQAVAAATGVVPTCYRPPYGAVDARVHGVAVSAGLANLEWQTGTRRSNWGLWDIDTNDWRLAAPGSGWTQADMRRQLDRSSDGDTVLLHDGGLGRARALAVLTGWLADNHDRFEFRALPGCGGAVTEQPLDPAHPERWNRFQIARLYRAYFDRAPDPEGWDYWNEVYAKEASLVQISQWFAESSEFARQGRQADGDFVTFVYLEVLEREPDADGFAYWMAELGAGLDRGALVTYFSESEEYIRRSAPALTGDCYSGEVGSSYRCWADRLAPPRTW
ncbi:MAG: polysaccharide deacetylase family protein [Acidimicrobiales bacterium]